MSKAKWILLGLAVFMVIGIGLALVGCETVGPIETTTTINVTTTTTTTTAQATTTTTTMGPTTTTFTLPFISGQVKFHDASWAGVKGGVEIGLASASAPETIIATTSANSNTGSYSFIDLTAGTYVLYAVKEGWTIPSIEATTSSSNAHFIADPTSWEVKYYDANIQLDTIGRFDTAIRLAGGSNASGAYLLYSNDTGESWSVISAPATIQSLVHVSAKYTTTPSLALLGWRAVDAQGNVWATSSTTNFDVFPWEIVGQLTDQAIIDANYASNDDQSFPPNWFIVTTSGQFIRIQSGSFYVDETAQFQNGGTSVPLGCIYNRAVGRDPGKARGWVNKEGLWQWSDLDVDGSLTSAEADLESLSAIHSQSSVGIITSLDGSIYTTTSFLTFSNWVKELSGVPYALKGCWLQRGAITPENAIVVGENGLIMRRK